MRFKNKKRISKHVSDLTQNLPHAVSEFTKEIHEIISSEGIQPAYNFLLQTEIMMDLRKPTLAIYDHAFHFIGGAQKYGLTMVSFLQDLFDITIIANKGVSHSDFLNWYGLDLSQSRIKIIKVPFFEKNQTPYIDPACISKEIENPFHVVSKESGNYDVFINNGMNEMVFPLSNLSVLVCHFPERRAKSYYYADEYDYLVCNSNYTAEWIAEKWRLQPHLHVYPPIEMKNVHEDNSKKRIILSVARFEVEGTKRQLEMVNAFIKINQIYPEIIKDWKLIVVGGSDHNNPYLYKLRQLINQSNSHNIELKINLPVNELKALYKDSTLFWHLCGLSHRDPSENEHFGMTIVEAMQNKIVPLVYDSGGPREIVDHGVNGFRVQSTAELTDFTIKLLRDPGLIQKLSRNASMKSREFSIQKFEEKIRSFFRNMMDEYSSIS